MRYHFTVVMAVYNTAPYLQEAVDSLILQDIGFDKIQLILVDDGSTDGSGAICDKYAKEYPDNVLTIHKPNGGVSSARNAGLEFARGKYVNFMDSDDRMSRDVFSKVYTFFEANKDKTDVVSIPLVFFEGRSGHHMLNDKYENGSRVIDLKKEWTTTQMHVASAFIISECLTGLRFKPELKYAEDAEFLQKVLLRKQNLGVVADAAYYYRARSAGPNSAIQNAVNSPANYLPKLEHFSEALISYCNDTFGAVPKFVQYALMYDLQWHIRSRELPAGVLSPEEERDYLTCMYRLLPYFDDDVICAAKVLSIEHKAFLLKKKHGGAQNLTITEDQGQILCGGQTVGTLDDLPICVNLIQLEANCCLLEATVSVLPGIEGGFFADCGGKTLPCYAAKTERIRTIFGEESLRQMDVHFSIPLTKSKRPHRFHFFVKHHGMCFNLPCRFMQDVPFSSCHKNSYICGAGWCIQYCNGEFSVSPAKRGTRLWKEVLLLSELFFGKHHQRKAGLLRLLRGLKKRIRRIVLPPSGRIGLLGRVYFFMKGEANRRAESSLPDPGDFPVDFVVPWVDDSDREWQEQKRSFEASEDQLSRAENCTARYREWGLFPYWFRAVEQYAPWVRNVYLITWGHLPPWLNTDHPKLRIIRHSDYIPEKYLPVFNSNPIELNLWRIPGLSEHFVCFNDDVYLNSPVKKEDFFSRGLPRYCAISKPQYTSNGMSAFDHILCNNRGLYNSFCSFRDVISKNPEKWFAKCYGKDAEYNRRTYKDGYLSGMLFSHVCTPCRKSAMEACHAAFPDALDETSSHRFRSPLDLNHQVFQLWEMVHADFEPVAADHFGFAKNIRRDTLEMLRVNLFEKPNLCVCANDGNDFPDEDYSFLREQMLAMFKTKFPQKSDFEL